MKLRQVCVSFSVRKDEYVICHMLQTKTCVSHFRHV